MRRTPSGLTRTEPRYDLLALLEQAGAHPRGRRFDCPKCGGLRTISQTQEVFFCHKCEWKGNTVTLAKELGLYQRLPWPEYIRQLEERERAARAAKHLYKQVKARRVELLDELHGLNGLESLAHKEGPENPATWDALAQAYTERPGILAELTFLETSPADKVLQFLKATTERRQAVREAILVHGGMYDHAGKFVEVCT